MYSILQNGRKYKLKIDLICSLPIIYEISNVYLRTVEVVHR
eukprot:UN21324